jgi:secretion/DNA translocation related CpaE-like protein
MSAPVLLVTRTPALVEDVGRLAAAVGAGLDVVPDLEAAARAWWEAHLVLLGDDAAAVGTPTRRGGLVLVCGEDAGDGVWRRALECGAEAVCRLPRDEAWALERLAAAVDGPGRGGTVVGVLPGRGGAGASTLAAGLATCAVERGHAVLLVDGDPLGGGLDLLLGAEDAAGLRWPDLTGLQGVVRGTLLRDGLPAAGGVRLLSFGRDEPAEAPAPAVEAVLDAGRAGSDLVVVDLPRREDPATLAALWRLDLLLLVVPAEVRAAAAAARLAERVGRHVADVRLVVRTRPRGGLHPGTVADAVGLPVAVRCGSEPDLTADGDRGEPPGARRRGPLARACRELLDGIEAVPGVPLRADRGVAA